MRGWISSFSARTFQHPSSHSTPLIGEFPAAQHFSACLAPRLAHGTSCCQRYPTAQAFPWDQTIHDRHDAEAPDALTSQPCCWMDPASSKLSWALADWFGVLEHRLGVVSPALVHEPWCGQQELLREPKCSLTSTWVGRV